MVSYDSYLLATLLPPVIIICTLLLLSHCAWGLSYLVFAIKKKRRAEQNAMEGIFVEYPGLQYMYMALQPLLGKTLSAMKARDRVKIKLHGEEISPGAVPFMAQMVVIVLGLAFAVFVTVLTVETSSVCDEKLDCFPFNYSEKVRPLSTDPIRNCTNYASNNYTVVCFQFSVRLIEALGTSGGTLALTVIGINFYVAFVFAIAQARWCRSTGVWGCMFLLLTAGIILLSTLLWVLPLALAESDTLKSVRNWESVLVYYYTIIYLLLVVTILPCCVPRYRQDFGAQWNRARRRYRGPNHGSESEEEEDEVSDLRSNQAGSTGYHISADRSTSQSYQTGTRRYHMPVGHRHQSLTERTSEAAPVPVISTDHREQSHDQEVQSSTSESSSTITTGAGEGEGEDRGATSTLLVRQKKSQGSKRASKHSSKRTGSGGRKNSTAVVRERVKEGGHWAERMGSYDNESKGEGGLTGRHRQNEWANEGGTSSSEEIGRQGSQETGEAGRGNMRDRRRGKEGARIRAVLTGGGVEGGEKSGDGSVGTHL